MSKSREVYSESFASRVAGIYNATKAVGSLAAKTFAPQLTQLAGEYSQNIKRVYRAFNEPKSALKDLFESNPDIFRDCQLEKLVEDSAAGAIAGTDKDSYKGSYKAIFKGYVKKDAANSPLQYSKNFSVTIKPNNPKADDSIKYVADRVVFKDDVEFVTVSDSASDPDTVFLKLFNTSSRLRSKFKLDTPIFFDRRGYVDRRDSSKGYKLNFKGKVIFGSAPARDVNEDEYIIVINNRGILQSDGELRTGPSGTVINSSVNINYNQKNILIESEKLVDLFCK